MNTLLTPASEEEIAHIISSAKDEKNPFEIAGAGTRIGLGRPLQTQKTLSLKKLSGISLYEPGALTIVAKAGTPVKVIERALAKEGQRLPFEPMDHRPLFATKGEPTIGGVVGANISGPRRIQAGACRDSLIGVRFVNGNGEIIKNGGRVMKNVTGLDLVKLMAGSYGTLGVLSEVSFKTLPISEREATLVIENLTTKQAIGVLSSALGSPYEVTGAAHIPGNASVSQTLLRIEGFDSQVTYRLKKLQKLVAQKSRTRTIEGAKHKTLWQQIRDVKMFAGKDNPVWKLSVKPGDAPAIHKTLSEQSDAEMLFDWGGGLIWVSVSDKNSAEERAIRNITRIYGGHATLVRGSDALRTQVSPFQPQSARVAKLSLAIRNRFDPAGILNPGRMRA